MLCAMQNDQQLTPGFVRTTQAIRYLMDHRYEQPSLATLAEQVGAAPVVVQREFRRLVGISPQRFLQHLNVQCAEGLLDRGLDVLRASIAMGLSGSGRLHDQRVRIEALTPGEWRQGVAGAALEWGLGRCAWGTMALAWTMRGLHRIEFLDEAHEPASFLAALAQAVPGGAWERHDPAAQSWLDRIFADCQQTLDLYLIATPFQAAVWRVLLTRDRCTTYQALAAGIAAPQAARAVGLAVGANPVALLIPCHRVLCASGALGGYRWGQARKLGLLVACQG